MHRTSAERGELVRVLGWSNISLENSDDVVRAVTRDVEILAARLWVGRRIRLREINGRALRPTSD